MEEFEDSEFMTEGTVNGGVYFILADTQTFWPDGQGTIKKSSILSAKNNGAKKIYINDLTTGVIYHTSINDALSGGATENAIFSKHNMKKLQESDMPK